MKRTRAEAVIIQALWPGPEPEILEALFALAESDPRVETVKKALTMHFDLHTILLAMDLRFRKDLSAAEVEESVDVIEDIIRRHHRDVKHIFIESDSLSSNERKISHE